MSATFGDVPVSAIFDGNAATSSLSLEWVMGSGLRTRNSRASGLLSLPCNTGFIFMCLNDIPVAASSPSDDSLSPCTRQHPTSMRGIHCSSLGYLYVHDLGTTQSTYGQTPSSSTCHDESTLETERAPVSTPRPLPVPPTLLESPAPPNRPHSPLQQFPHPSQWPADVRAFVYGPPSPDENGNLPVWYTAEPEPPTVPVASVWTTPEHPLTSWDIRKNPNCYGLYEQFYRPT
ncbi:hypothetical protein B0H13DRAFT_2656207 [Mycena leptocephala]|nr:hypothetical protein B0H13DRAFT_2656207 [Mycena leptocephala]